jgi:hypothetical protein
VLAAAGVLLAGVVGALALLLVASGGGADPEPTATPSPSPSPTPTPEGQTPSPTPVPPETAYQLVYREFGQTEDVIWRAAPSDPTQRVEMARIPHREGFGIKPSLSPDGKMLAYLSLPEHALSAQSSQAEAFILDLKTQDTVRVAEGIDLMFAPLWSPDGRHLFMRRLAGPEFLAADVIIVRVTVPPLGESTPTPTPTPPPSVTPVPTRPAEQDAFRDSIAHVLNFIPVGFSEDGESLFFVQIQGGTRTGSLLGAYRPATSESLDRAWTEYLMVLAASQPDPGATPTPAPEGTPNPTLTPFWETKLIVEMSDQSSFDYDLSANQHKLVYLVQEFEESGAITTKAYWASIIDAEKYAVTDDALPAGYHLRPLWHPDSFRLTMGVLPLDGSPGSVWLMYPDGAEAVNMTAGSRGFDEPRSWAPDGSWLAVTHSEGDLINRTNITLDLVTEHGNRITVIAGPDNATDDSVLGWIDPNAVFAE